MKETDEKSDKCTGKKPYIIGFIAGIMFVFIVVAVSGDEETDTSKSTKSSQVGRYVQHPQSPLTVLDTVSGDLYLTHVELYRAMTKTNWIKILEIK